MIENAALFGGGSRLFHNIDVDIDEDTNELVVLNRINKAPIVRYSIVEVAKQGEAWDVIDPTSQEKSLLRVVVQQGCGCSGMRPYTVDAAYSGPFR